MRPRKGVGTVPRARRGARRRGPAAIAAAAAVGLALASLAVAASAPAGSAAEPASVEVPAAGSILGVGSDGILGVDPRSSADDRGRPLLGSRRKAREPADPSGAFIYRKGKYRPLDGVSGAPLTVHVGLNNRGQIVGAFPVDESTLTRGFVRSRRGDYEGFDAAPGAPDRVTSPFDINDRGAIAGAYAVGSVAAPESVAFHGFLRKPSGAVITVDVPGASATGASGINNRGAVVGTYEDARGKGHGFLLRRGMVTPIDPPEANQDATFGNIGASDINDQGDHRLLPGRERHLPRVPLPQGAVHQARPATGGGEPERLRRERALRHQQPRPGRGPVRRRRRSPARLSVGAEARL
jgi:probable HAF family extracellular repeat protein